MHSKLLYPLFLPPSFLPSLPPSLFPSLPPSFPSFFFPSLSLSSSLSPSLPLSGVYVPLGGKKLLTYMDDLNMPAKDEYGSQPPLELVRQWIDYGFWYDRLKQTVKEIKVS